MRSPSGEELQSSSGLEAILRPSLASHTRKWGLRMRVIGAYLAHVRPCANTSAQQLEFAPRRQLIWEACLPKASFNM